MMIFDAHLDLSMNAIEWNRDLSKPLSEIRQVESHLKDKPDRGNSTVAFPEMRKGGIGVCVATQIARVQHNAYSPVAGWRSPAQAWAMTQAQLAWYREMESQGELTPVRNLEELNRQLSAWEQLPNAESRLRAPIGYILSLEGADSIVSLSHLEKAYGYGLRAIGPAHYGPGVYANGTDATGGFNHRGHELLAEIQRLGLILDATHLCDDCFWEAVDRFHGPIWASHQNCRSLVPHNRQWSDEQIKTLIERDGVLGAVFDGWMMTPNWVRGKTTPQSAGLMLERIVDHIDHICQLAGNSKHVGIGSDLDGAFGTEQTPQDLNSIADLQKLPDLLRKRGYSDADIDGIASGNFIRFLRRAWS
jgi:membrane dipeptidase